jgi:putative CocE/NonD family hydrolase
VAELNPPHLAAINPWEGWADTYREVAYHGGIPDTWFWPYLWTRWGVSSTRIEDWEAEMREHPRFDAFWSSKAADFSRIRTPAFIVASWSDQGLHTRGTLEGFKQIASEHKWLEVHGRKKWAYYYEPSSVARLQAFFDHFLRGMSTEITRWPRVRLEVRDRAYAGQVRFENEWPLARTQYTKLHLDALAGTLTLDPPAASAQRAYEAVPGLPEQDHASFEITFARDTEITGHAKLRLHVSAIGADDMDLFVGLEKIGCDGKPVGFVYYAQLEDGPMALGWIRASDRQLDPQRTTEHQPVIAHREVHKIEPGATVALDIEIWPSSTHFAAGEGLRLIVQGSDIRKYPKSRVHVYFRHEDSPNRGLHVIHTGPQSDSYLLVPIIP